MRSGTDKTFGELVGLFRTEAKLSQKRLAELMGKSRLTIVNWENGVHLPKERALVLDLAKHLGLDILKRNQLLQAALVGSWRHWENTYGYRVCVSPSW